MCEWEDLIGFTPYCGDHGGHFCIYFLGNCINLYKIWRMDSRLGQSVSVEFTAELLQWLHLSAWKPIFFVQYTMHFWSLLRYWFLWSLAQTRGSMSAWIVSKQYFEIFPLQGHFFWKVAKTWPFWEHLPTLRYIFWQSDSFCLVEDMPCGCCNSDFLWVLQLLDPRSWPIMTVRHSPDAQATASCWHLHDLWAPIAVSSCTTYWQMNGTHTLRMTKI